MTLLLDPARLPERRTAAKGALSPLARSLADDLAPLAERDPWFPPEKARLSRDGGRCPVDATLLEFDPASPRAHRCPACGRVFTDESHYRWWIMSYQLWLAERAVHGALLGLLIGDTAASKLSERILEGYVARYLAYPNKDNVLGPSRLFFSTYLESIWLLQVVVATDLLEAAGRAKDLSGRVRDAIVEPARAIIQSYDEGASNRQVWNNAALLAASALLGNVPDLEPLVWGPTGVMSHLARGLLADGTWYEGENYHLFAHRGLWYGVQLAERFDLGMSEPFAVPFVKRFNEGFAASFVTALPDLTLPARRDSQYAISVRQWRFAELCELGLARMSDSRLADMLGQLYADDIPRGDTGRARSTAEVERNIAPTMLTRADLGWRSLLFARALHAVAPHHAPTSTLLEGQGYAIFRRDAGRVYAALDYGHSGGGHGHPDRLNIQLAQGSVRWLDDMGTGSYVDPSLHWYRSTLAHNAPLVDGQSQARVHGILRAHDEREGAGWVDAEVSEIAPGVRVRRSMVGTRHYVLDVVTWESQGDITFDLPIHLDVAAPSGLRWTAVALSGGAGIEDGFDFASETAFVDRSAGEPTRLAGTRDGSSMNAWVVPDGAAELWRARAPGAPGHSSAMFYLIRMRGKTGRVRSLFDWSNRVHDVRVDAERVVVTHIDGTVDVHTPESVRWRIETTTRGVPAATSIVLDGNRPSGPSGVLDIAAPRPAPRRKRPRLVIPVVGEPRDTAPALELSLGEKHYRRSELPWSDAGSPAARVRLAVAGERLAITVDVRKADRLVFAPPRERNDLDNEPPDINSDGLQIHLAPSDPHAAVTSWLLVPESGTNGVRVSGAREAPRIDATWEPTASGYRVRTFIPLTDAMRHDGFDLDLIVNEMSADRERRRGQLVLSGGGDWIYLRGDRQSREALLPFVVENGTP